MFYQEKSGNPDLDPFQSDASKVRLRETIEALVEDTDGIQQKRQQHFFFCFSARC
jgi:hypothetical protein